MSNVKCEISVLSETEAEQIHLASARLLNEVGIKIDHPRLLDLLAEIGCIIDRQDRIVKIPLPLLEEQLKNHVKKHSHLNEVPKEREGKSTLSSHFFCTRVLDFDTGAVRDSTIADLEQSVIIGNLLENLRFNSPLVLPMDIPENIRDLSMWSVLMKRSLKKITCELHNYEMLDPVFELCVALAGSKEKALEDQLMCYFCFPDSPLFFSRYSLDMALKTIDLGMSVRFGCPMVVAGMTGPTTLAGTLTVGNAEYLAGVLMAEACGGNSFADMGISINYNLPNGVALYASPEKLLLNYALRDLGKFYGYKCYKDFGGHSMGSDAIFPGMQAGFEKGFSGMFSGLAGDSWLHCGALSSEVSSVPQMIIDNEFCDVINRIKRGIEVNEQTTAYEVIKSVGIRGNFLDYNCDEAIEHTARFCRQEHFVPKYFVRERPENSLGKKDLYQAAVDEAKRILKEHDPHPLTAEQERAIDEIVADCKKIYA